MKKYLLTLFALLFLAGTSCKEKIDIEKEAIKAVIEEEKNAFFGQDYARMAETWVQEPSSFKVFLTNKGYSKDEGWDAISKSDQKNVQDNSWDRKLMTLTFSNYQIDVMNNSAWVLLDAHWEGIYKGDTTSMYQTRINVLKKVDGKWKFTLMAMQAITPDKK
jgi:hypothetical protein